MRFETTPTFESDWARLNADERRLFAAAIRTFSDACDRVIEDPSISWPADLRVKKIRSAKGVFEMTWSFAGPDGRATWEWTNIDMSTVSTTESSSVVRVPAVRWRRVGGHRIFTAP